MGEVDEGQFWVGNPWRIVAEGKNLSGYERDRAFLNLGGGRFTDISYLTGVDHDGDSRAVIGADLDQDGMQDLIVRQAGGGPLLMFLNRFPKQHYLRVSLRGTRSNRLGVGTRLIAQVGSRQIVREMYPANTYASQAPSEVYFGLGASTKVDRLTIRWPCGDVQQISSIAADQNLRITEGEQPEALASAGTIP
jgi:hypothetical protein